jgi:acyl-lipid omega-6 desaturase (Delta-12 desaturase)
MKKDPDVKNINLKKLVAPYAQPDDRQSLWQLANTLLPFLAIWALMVWSLQVSYVLTLALAIPAAGFMMRTFIIFHDCCHGSFFKSRAGNEKLGAFLGVLMFTPYQHWKHAHAVHHATAGNLDKRGVGDVLTLTVEEYLKAPWWKRAAYRIMRNPIFMFTVGGFFMFTLVHRFWKPGSGKRERNSVIYTNIALAALILGLGWLVGFKEVFLVQTPILLAATSIGVWLFYVQHQFEGVYWERKDNWDFVKAGLHGSSFYKLPRLLQWFSGSIGFHHIHHLGPRIPNYKLEQCYRANPVFHVKPLTILSSFKCARLALWDEAAKCLVGFGDLKRYRTQNASG